MFLNKSMTYVTFKMAVSNDHELMVYLFYLRTLLKKVRNMADTWEFLFWPPQESE